MEKAVRELDESAALETLQTIIHEKLGSQATGGLHVEPSSLTPDARQGMSLPEIEKAVESIQDRQALDRLLQVLEKKVGRGEKSSYPEASVEDFMRFVDRQTEPERIKQLIEIAGRRVETLEKTLGVKIIKIEDIRALVAKLQSDKLQQDKFIGGLLEIVKENQPHTEVVSSVPTAPMNEKQMQNSIEAIKDAKTLFKTLQIVEERLMIVEKERPTRTLIQIKDIILYFMAMITPTGKHRPQLQGELCALIKEVLKEEVKISGDRTTVEKVLGLIKQMFEDPRLAESSRGIRDECERVQKVIDHSKASQALHEFSQQRLELAREVSFSINREPLAMEQYLKPEDLQLSLDFKALSSLSSEVMTNLLSVTKSLEVQVSKHSVAMSKIKDFLASNTGMIDQDQLVTLFKELCESETKIIGMRTVELAGLSMFFFLT